MIIICTSQTSAHLAQVVNLSPNSILQSCPTCSTPRWPTWLSLLDAHTKLWGPTGRDAAVGSRLHCTESLIWPGKQMKKKDLRLPFCPLWFHDYRTVHVDMYAQIVTKSCECDMDIIPLTVHCISLQRGGNSCLC